MPGLIICYLHRVSDLPRRKRSPRRNNVDENIFAVFLRADRKTPARSSRRDDRGHAINFIFAVIESSREFDQHAEGKYLPRVSVSRDLKICALRSVFRRFYGLMVGDDDEF